MAIKVPTQQEQSRQNYQNPTGLPDTSVRSGAGALGSGLQKLGENLEAIKKRKDNAERVLETKRGKGLYEEELIAIEDDLINGLNGKTPADEYMRTRIDKFQGNMLKDFDEKFHKDVTVSNQASLNLYMARARKIERGKQTERIMHALNTDINSAIAKARKSPDQIIPLIQETTELANDILQKQLGQARDVNEAELRKITESIILGAMDGHADEGRPRAIIETFKKFNGYIDPERAIELKNKLLSRARTSQSNRLSLKRQMDQANKDDIKREQSILFSDLTAAHEELKAYKLETTSDPNLSEEEREEARLTYMSGMKSLSERMDEAIENGEMEFKDRRMLNRVFDNLSKKRSETSELKLALEFARPGVTPSDMFEAIMEEAPNMTARALKSWVEKTHNFARRPDIPQEVSASMRFLKATAMSVTPAYSPKKKAEKAKREALIYSKMEEDYWKLRNSGIVIGSYSIARVVAHLRAKRAAQRVLADLPDDLNPQDTKLLNIRMKTIKDRVDAGNMSKIQAVKKLKAIKIQKLLNKTTNELELLQIDLPTQKAAEELIYGESK